MKIMLALLLVLALGLSGCCTTPPPQVQTCPKPPAHLLIRPQPLILVQPSVSTTPSPETAKPK